MTLSPFDMVQVQEDAAVMRELLKSEYWRVFQRHAEWEIETRKSRTLSESAKEFDYNKGCYDGMLALLNLPRKVLNLGDHVHANR